ncbi:MAG: GIY-YIG nuclease family protein [Planctomycetota bacterium]|jgi:putative endonuclease
MNTYWVYIMTNAGNTVLYTGVTNDLRRRVAQHRNGKGPKFTSKYNVTKLIFYESFGRIQDAIAAEKKIKAGSRAKKVELIDGMNPQWLDLYEQAFGGK